MGWQWRAAQHILIVSHFGTWHFRTRPCWVEGQTGSLDLELEVEKGGNGTASGR